jgi:hypothetical protein
VQRTRAELAGSWVAIEVVDPNIQQARADVELLKRLNGKGKEKGKCKAEQVPASKTRLIKYVFFLLLWGFRFRLSGVHSRARR